MARKKYYGAVDVPEPSAGASIPDAAASAAAAAAAKKDKAENAKIFIEGRKLPVDLTEKTQDIKPKGFAMGGGIPSVQVGSPVMMDRMPVMRPGAAPVGRKQLPMRPAVGRRMAKGGAVTRGDGCAQRGKTQGKIR